ncbi:MAG: hypothetical protein WCD80_03180 [Desulfobaccales bacterium]
MISERDKEYLGGGFGPAAPDVLTAAQSADFLGTSGIILRRQAQNG